ncbi:MAG: lipopolysaccharide kinase InaA family protein, partial [Acidimicrobiia bacterium]
MAELHVIGDHPDFLDLPWSRPLAAWESKRLVELPAGVHRHVVRFVAYERGVYAVKELPRHLARHEFDMLERLRALQAPAVEPVALIDRPEVDGSEEWASAVVTRYLDYAFSYREVIPTDTFTARSDKLLDAFAHLLVELHLVGCFWGDCSLSNVLYRWDAGAIAVRMVDAETVRLHPELTA